MDFKGDQRFSFPGSKFRGRCCSLFLETPNRCFRKPFFKGIPSRRRLARSEAAKGVGDLWCILPGWGSGGNPRQGQVQNSLVKFQPIGKKIYSQIGSFFAGIGAKIPKIFELPPPRKGLQTVKSNDKPSVFSFHVSFSAMATCPDMWFNLPQIQLLQPRKSQPYQNSHHTIDTKDHD